MEQFEAKFLKVYKTLYSAKKPYVGHASFNSGDLFVKVWGLNDNKYYLHILSGKQYSTDLFKPYMRIIKEPSPLELEQKEIFSMGYRF